MKYHVNYLGMYDQASYKEEFIQNIQQIVNVKFVGSFTLGDLENAFKEKYKDNEDYLLSALDFVEYQKEDGATNDASLYTADSEDEITYLAFDFRPNN